MAVYIVKAYHDQPSSVCASTKKRQNRNALQTSRSQIDSILPASSRSQSHSHSRPGHSRPAAPAPHLPCPAHLTSLDPPPQHSRCGTPANKSHQCQGQPSSENAPRLPAKGTGTHSPRELRGRAGGPQPPLTLSLPTSSCRASWGGAEHGQPPHSFLETPKSP